MIQTRSIDGTDIPDTVLHGSGPHTFFSWQSQCSREKPAVKRSWIEYRDSTTTEEPTFRYNFMPSNSNLVDVQALLQGFSEHAVDLGRPAIHQSWSDFTDFLLADLIEVLPVLDIDRRPSIPSPSKHDLSRTVKVTLLKIPHEIDTDYDVAPVASEIQELLIGHGSEVLKEIQRITCEGTLTTDATAEVLKLIGEVADSRTHYERRRFLEEVLLSAASSVVKDAANLGLAYMNDPAAIKSLREAISQEKSLLLKKLLKQTIEQLEKTLSELHP